MRVLKEQTARLLDSLLRREEGRIVSKPPSTTPPLRSARPMQWVYIESGTAIDTSITDPTLTKEYYDAHIVLYNAATEDTTNYADVYVTTIDDSALSEGYAFCRCEGEQTINNVTRGLYMPFSFAGSDTISIVTCVRLEEA